MRSNPKNCAEFSQTDFCLSEFCTFFSLIQVSHLHNSVLSAKCLLASEISTKRKLTHAQMTLSEFCSLFQFSPISLGFISCQRTRKKKEEEAKEASRRQNKNDHTETHIEKRLTGRMHVSFDACERIRVREKKTFCSMLSLTLFSVLVPLFSQ